MADRTGGVLKDLAVILPTRHRRAAVERFLAAFYATVELPPDLIVVTDGDDPAYDGLDWRGARQVVLPNLPLVPKFNQVALEAAEDYRAVMFIGDDNVPVTPGWDRLLMETLDGMGGTGVVAANERLRSEPWACHAIISSDIIKALGWFFEPAARHYNGDVIWMDLSRSAGCFGYREDVLIDHLHPAFGRGPSDALYESTVNEHWDHDAAELTRWETQRRDADRAVVAACVAAKAAA
jgi:hypothetical protein